MQTNYDGKTTLSIIIPCWLMNGELIDYTQACLKSIFDHTTVPYEVILVDNGSATPGAQFLRAMQMSYPQVRRHRFPENRGYAPAVNAGYRQAAGQFIAVMNNDIVVGLEWAERLIQATWLIDGPTVLTMDNVAMPGVMRDDLRQPGESKTQGIARVQESGFWRPTYKDLEVFPPLDGWGALYLAHRGVFQEVEFPNGDLLDEGYELGMFEDRDLWLRLHLNGNRRVRTHRCWVEHIGNATWGKLPNQHEIYQRNQGRYHEKLRSYGFVQQENGEWVRVNSEMRGSMTGPVGASIVPVTSPPASGPGSVSTPDLPSIRPAPRPSR